MNDRLFGAYLGRELARLTLGVLAAAIVFSFLACGKASEDGGSGSSQGSYETGLSGPGEQWWLNPWWFRLASDGSFVILMGVGRNEWCFSGDCVAKGRWIQNAQAVEFVLTQLDRNAQGWGLDTLDGATGVVSGAQLLRVTLTNGIVLR